MVGALASLSLALVPFAQTTQPVDPTDWSRFRGPNGSGVAVSAENLPVDLAAEGARRWSAPVPKSSSSPVLTADTVYVTASTATELLVIALDRATGDERWRRAVARAYEMEFYEDNDSACPSPATDGVNVYVFFPELGLLSFDAAGEERWRLELGPFVSFYGMSGSPIVAGDQVLLLADQQHGSYLLAVDAANGEERWRTERGDVIESYTTPILHPSPSEPTHVICFGAFSVRAYAVADGEEAWRRGGTGYSPVPSPLVEGDRLYVCAPNHGENPFPGFDVVVELDADGDDRLSKAEVAEQWMAGHFGWIDADRDGHIARAEWDFVRAGMNNRDHGLVAFDLSTAGAETPMSELWRHTRATPSISSPILVDGTIFLARDGGVLTALDAASGEVTKQERLEGLESEVWASPVAGDGKLYVFGTDGRAAVLAAQAEWELLGTSELGAPVRATPAIAGDALYVRTDEAVLCLGAPRAIE